MPEPKGQAWLSSPVAARSLAPEASAVGVDDDFVGLNRPEEHQQWRSSGAQAQPETGDARTQGPVGGGRRKPCPFCREKVDLVDYKDIGALRRAVSDKGKIRSSRVTGACRRHQAQLARAVKRARELGLLPYVSDR